MRGRVLGAYRKQQPNARIKSSKTSIQKHQNPKTMPKMFSGQE